ncbi:hypothetical protein [Paraburkholderia sacchari]|uniref:Uncharacterized protein n=1 Tax=Paraburkholderia sacchari TaxID=159450 RepID=A0A8T6Z869_9BURK|nr:hypothetical protein [Paraburkholderia sacchari]NLP60404.1 hypothetical protein [Paraburkholderia sacchari]
MGLRAAAGPSDGGAEKRISNQKFRLSQKNRCGTSSIIFICIEHHFNKLLDHPIHHPTGLVKTLNTNQRNPLILLHKITFPFQWKLRTSKNIKTITPVRAETLFPIGIRENFR